MKTIILETKLLTKVKDNPKDFSKYIENISENSLQYLLERLGKLNSNSFKIPLIKLLKSKNSNIRALALKNLAKLTDISLLNTYINFAYNDESTSVRRESVSAIGRLKNKTSIPYLIKLLKDPDPKIVMQSIRALMIFCKDEKVIFELKNLINHPNEVIREIIEKELFKSNINENKKNNISHIDHYPFMRNIIVNADVLDTIKIIPDDSIHLTFTSPPYYNARDYSIYQSYEEYLSFLEKVFTEVYRITKEGRFFILNTSPIIIPRISRAYSSKRYPIPFDIHPFLIKMGWEFIDDIIWVKNEASVKNRNAGFFQHRKPLAYKPNARTEMIMVYRKKTDKLLDWNIHQYPYNIVQDSKIKDKYETSNVWNIDPTFDKVHSAVFPIELCNRIIKFYSYKNDLVFDPFAGSGTLGKSVILNNRFFFMIEKEKKYVERIKEEMNKLFSPMFSKNKYKIFDLENFKLYKNNYDIK